MTNRDEQEKGSFAYCSLRLILIIKALESEKILFLRAQFLKTTVENKHVKRDNLLLPRQDR